MKAADMGPPRPNRTGLVGVTWTTHRLKSGELRTYYYHGASNTRLKGELGSLDFFASYRAALLKLPPVSDETKLRREGRARRATKAKRATEELK